MNNKELRRRYGVGDQIPKEEIVTEKPQKAVEPDRGGSGINLPITPDKWLAAFKQFYRSMFNVEWISSEAGLVVIQHFNADKIKKGVCIIGPPGTGKTSLMMAVSRMMLYTQHGQFQFYSTRKMAAHFQEKDSGGMRVINSCCRMPACIDDIGAEPISSHMGNKINISDAIVEGRYSAGLLTSVTTNLNKDDLEEFLGARSYSRLCQMCVFYTFKGKDYRRQ